jgi:hypothetical protein
MPREARELVMNRWIRACAITAGILLSWVLWQAVRRAAPRAFSRHPAFRPQASGRRGVLAGSSFPCPVCGFCGLETPARTSTGGASDQICESCGFQFGYTDDALHLTYAQWRARWIEKGMPWDAEGEAPRPSHFQPAMQLKRLQSLGFDPSLPCDEGDTGTF